uniref:VWFD domain-containing protein n=1 Tax=Sphaeramia orbicularis TaxID=375764 RepID=A0A673A3J1_9TELE
MRGRVCGICGMADGQVSKGFYGPDGHEIKNPVSFTHSWVLSAQSCRDNSGELCRGRSSSRVSSDVLSVERVLQCLPGCSPVRTTPITVGFNCQQAGDSEVTSVHNHSADLMETVQAHLGCSCNAQCS